MPLSVTNPSSGWYKAIVPLLLVIILLQWGLMSYLLVRHDATHHQPTLTSNEMIPHPSRPAPQFTNSSLSTTTKLENPRGVMVTVIFKAPKWFHLRYTMMLHNALVNSPDDWAMQLFLNKDWINANMIDYHPGFLRLLAHPRVHTTILPDELAKGKPKGVPLSRWFWESMLADHVFLFSGNGAFCGNYKADMDLWTTFPELDFVGAPTHLHGGMGGDGGTHSFRNRHTMLQALDYLHQKERQLDHAEHSVFLETLLEMNKKNLANFRIATVEQTQAFGGVYNLSSADALERLPLVVAGTQARLQWEERESLLKHCPEIRMIFPSMHEPACFGAHPDPETCKASICALQDEIPAWGC